MKNTIGISDVVHLDDHVRLFIDNLAHLELIEDIHMILMDTYGTAIAYQFDMNGPDPFKTLDYFTEWQDTIEHRNLLNNVTMSLRYNQVMECYQVLVNVVNPVLEEQVLIGAIEFVFKDTVSRSECQPFLDHLIAHYFEQMCHHLQMVLVNYEKLYYVIDVYTELLIHKDKFMPYHMTNVANWCMMLAVEMDLTSKEQMVLYVSALIHDIGKMFIPDDVLNKPSKLDDVEYTKMKQHPMKGYQMALASLYGMTLYKDVPSIIKHHHEKFDGTGYPSQLKGREIPLSSRIIAVADTVDAMMSRRAYKDRTTADKIITELARCSGLQFDPIIADRMIGLLERMNFSQAESTVSSTHFVPQAALSFYYRDLETVKSISGNLILQEGTGKLLIHSDNHDIESLDVTLAHRASISYYRLTDLLEYSVDIDGILNDQIYLSNFRAIPTDKYFSIVWEGTAVMSHSAFGMHSVNLVKLGGDTLLFEAPMDVAAHFISYRGEVMKVYLDLNVDDFKTYFELEGKIVKYYHFGAMTTFVVKFLNMSTANRDRMLRLLFKRQIQQKQSRSSAVKVGKHDSIL